LTCAAGSTPPRLGASTETRGPKKRAKPWGLGFTKLYGIRRTQKRQPIASLSYQPQAPWFDPFFPAP
jgi:hypothetical protein